MPAGYDIDKELNVISSRAWGTLCDSDVLEHQRLTTTNAPRRSWLGSARRVEPTVEHVSSAQSNKKVQVSSHSALNVRPIPYGHRLQ